jgi:hypothetical protein
VRNDKRHICYACLQRTVLPTSKEQCIFIQQFLPLVFDKLQRSQLLSRDGAGVLRIHPLIKESAAIYFNGIPSMQGLIRIILTPPGIPP